MPDRTAAEELADEAERIANDPMIPDGLQSSLAGVIVRAAESYAERVAGDVAAEGTRHRMGRNGCLTCRVRYEPTGLREMERRRELHAAHVYEAWKRTKAGGTKEK